MQVTQPLPSLRPVALYAASGLLWLSSATLLGLSSATLLGLSSATLLGQTPQPVSSNGSSTASTQGSFAASAENLTVMSWNLEWFYDDQTGDNFSKLGKEQSAKTRVLWDARRDAFASQIAKVSPTILGVQEVESRRVLWYLSQALSRNHQLKYRELGIEVRDHYTEQDVGFLIRPPVDVLRLVQGGYPQRMRATNQYYDLTKHLMAVLEFEHSGQYEQVLVINVHLRAGEKGGPYRLRQARLMHHWLRSAVAAGQNVIALGDFNTDERGELLRIDSDIGIATGLHTADRSDDLIDLNQRIPKNQRQTHLLPGRQFDRILCSPSLLEDDPARPDLVFKKIEVLRELAVRGDPDTPDTHWESDVSSSSDQRDLSDHYPVMATFEVR